MSGLCAPRLAISSRCWRRERSLPDYLHRAAAVRREQARDLLEAAERREGPLLLTGDFNTPPGGRIYREITSRFTDCFAAAGWGWGYTFPAKLPLLRIDYVFHSPGWRAVRCEAGAEPGSDHRPLLAELELIPHD